jgi:hypothetical protein
MENNKNKSSELFKKLTGKSNQSINTFENNIAVDLW